MHERFTWTASLGRWFGVPLRLHMLFVLFAIVVCFMEWHGLRLGVPLSGTALATIAVLLISVLIHELAHAFANANLGGEVEDISLTPWGGASRLLMPPDPRAQLLVNLAGPFTNGIIFVIGALLLVHSGNARLAELVHPLEPILLVQAFPEVSILKIATWVNFQLLIINLLPVYPLDGNHALRAILYRQNRLWNPLKIETAVLVIGVGTALLICGLAWVLREELVAQLFPGWLLFLMAGVVLITSARYGFYLYTLPDHELIDPRDESLDQHEGLYDDDFPDFELEEEGDLSISQWLQEKQDARDMLEQEIEREEERRADDILQKLHRDGLDSLTDDERSLLNRVSARYRRRRHLKS